MLPPRQIVTERAPFAFSARRAASPEANGALPPHRPARPGRPPVMRPPLPPLRALRPQPHGVTQGAES